MQFDNNFREESVSNHSQVWMDRYLSAIEITYLKSRQIICVSLLENNLPLGISRNMIKDIMEVLKNKIRFDNLSFNYWIE